METVKSLRDILSVLVDKSPEAQELVTRAYEFAKEAHKEQKRYSGAPYFVHLSEVGFSLAEIGMDAPTVAAGLLHDSIEDVGVTPEVMREKFGDEILALVEGVTKLGTLRYRGLERHTESLRKLFAATAEDLRVLIIKLMDRLHNAKTLEFVPAHKRKRIALETLEIYAPIADRLGMSVVKTDLEDAAFPYAFPAEYERVTDLLKERHQENEHRLEKMERALKKELASAGIRAFRTESRKKGAYSLFKKLERKEWDIGKIHDIIALRVIVSTMADCYTIFGLIHAHWRPVTGKIKDYIANPKPNGYQSIHTTVYSGDGGTIEIQVRTEEMHREALFGIASHLGYKDARGYITGKDGSSVAWVRQFLGTRGKRTKGTHSITSVPSWVHELASVPDVAKDSSEYLEHIKTDFFEHRIFVFTPKGDPIDLPLGASPIDFAYAIHSDIGDHISGAKVNGKLVSLDTALKNGDMVEIVTKESAKPSKKWIDIAKTSMAKKHIRTYLGIQQ
jgi:GTP pyrophosphokinase